MVKYYCEYCDIYLTRNNEKSRLQHRKGKKHMENVTRYYQKIYYKENPIHKAIVPPKPNFPPLLPPPPHHPHHPHHFNVRRMPIRSRPYFPIRRNFIPPPNRSQIGRMPPYRGGPLPPHFNRPVGPPPPIQSNNKQQK